MNRVGAVLRRLDPWATLLIGVLVVLGVIILLATPGPWRRVVGAPAAVKVAPPAPPRDIAAFVMSGTGGRVCTGVVWLHVERAPASLVAVVVAPPTQGSVEGGGYAPVAELATDVGPAAAARALGQALGVGMDAWIALDSKALHIAVPTMFPLGEGRGRLTQYRRADAAWSGRGGVRRAWAMQVKTLGQALPRVPFGQLGVIAFTNYVLGFGFVRSDLDLQDATSLGRTVRGLKPENVTVCAAPAVVQASGAGRAWRVDQSALDTMRRTLAAGLAPPASPATVRVQPLARRVLVLVAGDGPATDAYVRDVRRRLRRSAGAPVNVISFRAGAAGSLVGRLTRSLDASRPLAVLVATPLALDAPLPGTSAEELNAVIDLLRRRQQPAVVCAPLAVVAASDAVTEVPAILDAAVTASGLPVSTAWLPANVAATAPARLVSGAASASVATLVRACWPATLAPRLSASRIGFSYAARREAAVGVLGAGGRGLGMARLAAYGYRARTLERSEWQPPYTVSAVYYEAGSRRAAVALAGDLRLGQAAVMIARLPAPVTLSP